MRRVILSRDYEWLGNRTDTLPDEFESSGKLLYSGRNRLRLFEFNDSRVVVKKFGINRVKRLLSLFKSSKALKSYRNGCHLRDMGVATPQPIGYIEVSTRMGLVKEAYYLSEYMELPPIADCYNDEIDFDREVISSFARFVADLHQKGIIHRDLNSTNVRYDKTPDKEISFYLIDLNRMSFYHDTAPLSPATCFKNITRFSCNSEMFKYFVDRYIDARGWDKSYRDEAIAIKIAHDKRVDRKKSLKKLI